MSDLEELGLIYAPHISAGRIPTQTGLRLFVDGLLELGSLDKTEREQIEKQLYGREGDHKRITDVLAEAGDALSGLSRCAGVVIAERQVSRIKHIEFLRLDGKRALLVLVDEDGNVENRVLTLPEGLPQSSLTEATNYLNARVRGASLEEARRRISQELEARKAELDDLTARVIQLGLAEWSGDRGDDNKSLIVKGQSRLLENLNVVEDLERIRLLFEDLESKKGLIQLLELAENAEGVRIFIGSENHLFSLSGSSLIVAPFRDSDRKIVGVLGVIGPTRLNYGRIIPMVDYTARVVSRVLA
jgi:heat-inducible transcriptional repressor